MVRNHANTAAINAKGDKPGRTSCLYCGSVCALCLAFFLLAAVLLFSILFVVLEIPHGFQSLTLRFLIAEAFSIVVVPFIVFVSEIIRSVFPWPIIALTALWLVAWGPDRLRAILSSAKLELPGIKFEGGAAVPEAFNTNGPRL